MTNTELLKYANAKESQRLLTNIEQQTLFCLKIALAPNPCPACKTPVNLIDAASMTLDEYPAGHGAKAHNCPTCTAPLEQRVPFLPHGNGGWYWQVKGDWIMEQINKAKGEQRTAMKDEIIRHVAQEMAKGFADTEDRVYCPEHSERRKSLKEAVQREVDECCVYVCTACGAVCDPIPF